MNRYHLLAAETYYYSLANYEDHLGIGNVRFEKLMPDTVRVLEAAEREGWPVETVARKLDWEVELATEFQRRFRRALAVVDAKNAAESFRWSVRHCIEQAIAEGLRDEPSIERLVTQICYRASDLSVLLEREKKSLSDYSEELRNETGEEW